MDKLVLFIYVRWSLRVCIIILHSTFVEIYDIAPVHVLPQSSRHG